MSKHFSISEVSRLKDVLGRGDTSTNTKYKTRSRRRAPWVGANLVDALEYANIQMADPATSALYESHARAKGRTPRGLAIFDFLTAPTIRRIDATKYTGVVGEMIRIRAVDDFMVVTVGIMIINPQGEMIERGYATPRITQDHWVYCVTQWNECLAGCTIVVSAHDVAGNITSQTLTLH